MAGETGQHPGSFGGTGIKAEGQDKLLNTLRCRPVLWGIPAAGAFILISEKPFRDVPVENGEDILQPDICEPVILAGNILDRKSVV